MRMLNVLLFLALLSLAEADSGYRIKLESGFSVHNMTGTYMDSLKKAEFPPPTAKWNVPVFITGEKQLTHSLFYTLGLGFVDNGYRRKMTTTGSSGVYNTEDESVYTRNVPTVVLPTTLLLRYMGANWRPYVEGGAYYGRILSESERLDYTSSIDMPGETPSHTESYEIDYTKGFCVDHGSGNYSCYTYDEAFSRNDYGIVFGFGLDANFKPFSVGGIFRYFGGFANHVKPVFSTKEAVFQSILLGLSVGISL